VRTTLGSSLRDGKTCAPFSPLAPGGWGFWRVKENAGIYYAAAYQDGDKSVVLYTSKDGAGWAAGPQIYGVSADTPLETELTFMPDGHLLALVRMDGTPGRTMCSAWAPSKDADPGRSRAPRSREFHVLRA
jgi:hypothetical protein